MSAGSSFYSAAAAFPQVFEFQWIEAIRTGEVTGKMAQVLLELNKQIRDSRDTKRKVKGALMYPMILISVAVIAVTVMLWLVVPTFAKMFEDMDAKLPAITQFVVDASNYIVKYGIYGVIVVMATIVGFKRFMKTETGRKYVGGAMMVVPTVGQLVVEMAMYRFASNLSLLLKSGVPMMETMYTVKGIFQTSPIYRDALERVAARVAAGKPLYAALQETGLFLPMLVSMVQVGEESGQLPQVMEQIAPVLQRKDGRHDLEGHENAGAAHDHVHGLVDCGPDAGDLYAHVRHGWKCEVKTKGYSLIEMLIAMVVFATLISMGIPHFQQSLEQSRADMAGANLRAIWSAQRLYWLENRTYSPDLPTLLSANLIDPSLTTTTSPYTYQMASSSSTWFTATATRTGSTAWTGTFTIAADGTFSGTIQQSGGSVSIVPGFQ